MSESELLARPPERLDEDGNLWRIVVRDEILDWLATFRARRGETFDSIISRLIDHEIALREQEAQKKEDGFSPSGRPAS